MEKAKKIALQNFEREKLAHKIWAKNAQNRAKISKKDTNCTKKAKTIKKLLEKPKISTPVKKISTDGVSRIFDLC